MSTKEVLLARLREHPQTKDELLIEFPEASQMRGAASVLAYLVRSGQVAVDEAGTYSATGEPPRKDPAQAKPKKKRQAPPPGGRDGAGRGRDADRDPGRAGHGHLVDRRAHAAARRRDPADVAGRGARARGVPGARWRDRGDGVMAAGSQAAARERLQAAHYRTGRAQHEARCDGCMHCTDAATGKQHGRYCEAHRAAVKTYGLCDWWARRSAQR